jgi:hypothetical protein
MGMIGRSGGLAVTITPKVDARKAVERIARASEAKTQVVIKAMRRDSRRAAFQRELTRRREQ